MYPHVGPLPASLVGWIIAVALAGGSGVWFMGRAGMTARQITLSIVSLTISLLAGAKLLYLGEAGLRGATFSDFVWAEMSSVRLRMPGGLVLALAVSVPVARLMRLQYLRVADAVIPAAGLLIVGTRIGCFLQGCCYGVPSSLPWAVRFPAASDAFRWQLERGLIWFDAHATLPVHPLQLYFGITGLVLAVGLTRYTPHKRYDGEVLLLFAFLYLWSTWLLEHLRAQPHALTQQLVLLGAIALSTLGAVIEWRRHAARRPLIVSTQQRLADHSR